jgi:hypothetical protein
MRFLHPQMPRMGKKMLPKISVNMPAYRSKLPVKVVASHSQRYKNNP